MSKRCSATPLATTNASSVSMTMAAEAATEEKADADGNQYRLTPGVRARTVIHICKSATLCTASSRHSGAPFGSHVDFVQDEQGCPVFLLATNANHTKNLGSDPSCSLYCQPAATAGQDGGRVTLVGAVRDLDGPDADELRELYIDTHVHAQEALQYADAFGFYRMRVDDVFFVGGYGVTSQWVSSNDFATAEPDPLAFDAPTIVARLNEDKEADLKRLCRVFLDIGEVVRCKMTSLDRLGFDLRVRDEDGDTREYRVAFRENVQNRFDVESELVKTFQEAWECENGFDATWEGESTRPIVLYFNPKGDGLVKPVESGNSPPAK